MKWINALGLLFQFLAFWLAAPELLGESTLKRLRSSLEKIIATLPLIIVSLIILGYGVTFSVLGIIKGLKAAQEGISKDDLYGFIVVMAICTILYFVFLIFYKHIRYWLHTSIAKPLVVKLIEQSETRSTALVIGAILFTIGFLLQVFTVLY